MDLYDRYTYDASKRLTLLYSTSFGKSTRLFSPAIRTHIYAIYGLVRIADEIVDTYKGTDKAQLLHELETETYAAIKRGYSTNPIVHAFALTAAKYDITKELIAPFFESMAMDLTPQTYTDKKYKVYIYGSAEVVGLMCLKVFVGSKQYEQLKPGAQALGAAYQKVNFLRDMAADYKVLGRTYFPGVLFEKFNETDKQAIVADIEQDIAHAKMALVKLPASSRHAVALSLTYYGALLQKLKRTPATEITKKRVRINDAHKALIMAKTHVKRVVSRG